MRPRIAASPMPGRRRAGLNVTNPYLTVSSPTMFGWKVQTNL